eukprot:3812909-Prymnesium_polylepis.2
MGRPCDCRSPCSRCPWHTMRMLHPAHHRRTCRQMHRCTSRCTRQPTWAARPTVGRRLCGCRNRYSRCPSHTMHIQHLARRRRSSRRTRSCMSRCNRHPRRHWMALRVKTVDTAVRHRVHMPRDS